MTDRNAVMFLLWLMHPEITIVWAGFAYAGQLLTWAKTYLNLTIEAVSCPKDATGIVVPPRSGVVMSAGGDHDEQRPRLLEIVRNLAERIAEARTNGCAR